MSTFFENDRATAVAHRIFLKHLPAVNRRLTEWLGRDVDLHRLGDVAALRLGLLREGTMEDSKALAEAAPRYFWLDPAFPLTVGMLEPVDGLFQPHAGALLLEYVDACEKDLMSPTTVKALRDIALGTEWAGEMIIDYDGLVLSVFGAHGCTTVGVYRDGAGNLVAEWGPGDGVSEGLEMFEDFPKGFIDQNPGAWRLGSYASLAPTDVLEPELSLLEAGVLPRTLPAGVAFVHGKREYDPQTVLEAHRDARWIVWGGKVWPPNGARLVEVLLRYFGDPRADAPMGVEADGRKRWLIKDVTVGDDVVARFTATTVRDRKRPVPGWANFAPARGLVRMNVDMRDLTWGLVPASEPVISVDLAEFATGDWIAVDSKDGTNRFWRIGENRWGVVDGSEAWD